jgi:hypothetical protein
LLALALPTLVAFAFIAIGGGALLAPRIASQQYGIVLDDARALALIRAMGVRDLLIGVFVLLLLVAGRSDLLALGLAASAGVALLDLAVVWRDPAGRRAACWLHAGGAVGLLIAALALAAG